MPFQAEYQKKKRNIRSLDGAIMLFFTLLSRILQRLQSFLRGIVSGTIEGKK